MAPPGLLQLVGDKFMRDFVNKIINKKLIRQFWKYFLVAGLGYIVDFGTLFVLHDFFHVHYLLAAAISFILGLIVVYIMSNRYVFYDSKIRSKYVEIGIFALIGIVGLGILSVSMWALTGLLGINYLLSKIVATVGVYMWNFFARRAMYNN